jgi:hypothetical protein
MQRQTLEDAVVAAVRAGHVRARAIERYVRNELGEFVTYRQIDRALQRSRQAGAIRYDCPGGWRVVGGCAP